MILHPKRPRSHNDSWDKNKEWDHMVLLYVIRCNCEIWHVFLCQLRMLGDKSSCIYNTRLKLTSLLKLFWSYLQTYPHTTLQYCQLSVAYRISRKAEVLDFRPSRSGILPLLSWVTDDLFSPFYRAGCSWPPIAWTAAYLLKLPDSPIFSVCLCVKWV